MPWQFELVKIIRHSSSICVFCYMLFIIISHKKLIIRLLITADLCLKAKYRYLSSRFLLLLIYSDLLRIIIILNWQLCSHSLRMCWFTSQVYSHIRSWLKRLLWFINQGIMIFLQYTINLVYSSWCSRLYLQVYPEGKMSQHFASLKAGDAIEVKG